MSLDYCQEMFIFCLSTVGIGLHTSGGGGGARYVRKQSYGIPTWSFKKSGNGLLKSYDFGVFEHSFSLKSHPCMSAQSSDNEKVLVVLLRTESKCNQKETKKV